MEFKTMSHGGGPNGDSQSDPRAGSPSREIGAGSFLQHEL